MKKKTKKIIKQVSFFLIVLILAIFVINQLYINLILEKKILYRTNAEYKEYISTLENKEIKFAFFGASHTRDDVSTEVINDSFNFGSSGENYLKIYYKMRRVLEQDNIDIDTAILEVDIHTFSSFLVDETRLLNNLEYYSQFMSYKEISMITGKSYPRIWIDSHFPFIGNGQDMTFILFPYDTNMYRGWIKRTGNLSSDPKKEERAKKAVGHLFRRTDMIAEGPFGYFLETIKLAKKHDVKLVFIQFPIPKEYKAELEKLNVTREPYYDYIFKEVEKNIGANYTRLDYYDFFGNNSDFFADSNHLNIQGAKVFSRQLSDDLISQSNRTFSSK